MKARTQTSASGFGTLARGQTFVEFYETYVLNGTGELTALFAVDFASIVTGPDLGTLNTRVEADLSVNNAGASRPTTSSGTGINTPTLSSLVETGDNFSFDDRILSVTTEFENAEDQLFTVLWRLEVSSLASEQGTAIADASNVSVRHDRPFAVASLLGL